MPNERPPLTLAELVKLDWLILKHGKLLTEAKMTLRRISESGHDTAEQSANLATIQKQQNDFIAMRQTVRKHFTRSRLGPSFTFPRPAAQSQTAKIQRPREGHAEHSTLQESKVG